MKKSIKITMIVIASIVAAVALAIVIFTSYTVVFDKHPKTTYDVSQKQDDGYITVMSFNVRCLSPEDVGNKTWFNRADCVIKQIEDTAPDIICFQEVTPFHEDYFKYALKGYQKIILYRQGGPFGEATPIYFNEAKFELLDYDNFWLSTTPEKKSKSWGSSIYRVCSCAKLREKATNKVFAVFNTHLDHKSENARINGIQLVLDKISQFDNIPTILLGDMNSFSDSETYKKATENFADSRVVAENSEPNRNTFHKYGAVQGDSAMDYCFVTPNAFDVYSYHVLAEKVEGKFASDHYAIVIKLNVK